MALAPEAIPAMRQLEDTYLRLKTNDPTLDKVVIDFKSRGFQADAFFPEAAFELFADAFKENTVTTELQVRNMTMGISCAQHLSEIFRSNKKLTLLSLQDIRSTEAASLAIAQALQHNTTLEKIHLRAIGMTSAGAASFGQVLEKNTSLKELKLGHNVMDASAASVFARGLQKTTSLITLDMENNAMDDVVVKELAWGIETNSSLESLCLDFNPLDGSKGVAALARMLRENTTLQELSLFGNHIDAQGAECLASALQVNSSLKTLNLSFNNIGHVGAAALARALETNTTLEKLWLPANRLGNKAVQAFGESLPSMRGLKSLNLGDVFDNDGARFMLEGLRANQDLHTLHLESVLFDDTRISKEIDLLLIANNVGRRILREPNVDLGVWPLLLERANQHDPFSPSGLYYFTREKPELFSYMS